MVISGFAVVLQLVHATYKRRLNAQDAGNLMWPLMLLTYGKARCMKQCACRYMGQLMGAFLPCGQLSILMWLCMTCAATYRWEACSKQ